MFVVGIVFNIPKLLMENFTNQHRVSCQNDMFLDSRHNEEEKFHKINEENRLSS